MVTPMKKKRGEEHLPDYAKEHNRFVNTHRYMIERTIANIKTWRILRTGYRRPLRTFRDASNAVRELIFFIQKRPIFPKPHRPRPEASESPPGAKKRR
ncbi:hypothetical protein ACVLV4_001049 [Rathayibacter agropyri]